VQQGVNMEDENKKVISYAQYHVEACMIKNQEDIKRKLESYHKERQRLEEIRNDIIEKEEEKNEKLLSF
jgi:hypothetical protein